MSMSAGELYDLQNQLEQLQQRIAALEQERLEEDSEEPLEEVMLDPSVFSGAHDLTEGIEELESLEDEGVTIVLPAAVRGFLEEGEAGDAFVEFFGDHPSFDRQSYEQFVEYYQRDPDRVRFYDVPDKTEELFEAESIRASIEESLDVPPEVQEEFDGWSAVVETLAQEFAFMRERGTVVARKPRAFNTLVNVVDASVSVGTKVFDRVAGIPLKKRGPLSNRERLRGVGKWTGTIVSAGEVLPLLGVPMLPGLPTALGVMLMADP